MSLTKTQALRTSPILGRLVWRYVGLVALFYVPRAGEQLTSPDEWEEAIIEDIRYA